MAGVQCKDGALFCLVKNFVQLTSVNLKEQKEIA